MNTHTHTCGGTILDGGDHSYCDTCRAYAYDGQPVPSGTDRAANRAAWDAGDSSSPDADPVVWLWDGFGVRGIGEDRAREIVDAADDGGTIQGGTMVSLFPGAPEMHTCCSIRQALLWSGAELIDED